MSRGIVPYLVGLHNLAPKCKECGEIREYWDDELCVKCRKKKESERMTEERPIDMIVKQIETLLASMPYDTTLNDVELWGEIYNNKSSLLEGLKRGISVERILRVIR